MELGHNAHLSLVRSIIFNFRSVEATAAMLADRDDGGRDPGRGRKIGGNRDFRPVPDPGDEDDDYIVEDSHLRSHVHFSF